MMRIARVLREGVVSDVALYFPHIWVRDETWLKAALLYWPRIARMVPPVGDRGYHSWSREADPPGPWHGCLPRDVHDHVWQATDALTDVSVDSVEQEVASEFIPVLEEHAVPLRQRYGLATIIGNEPYAGYLVNSRYPPDQWYQLEWVHCDKMIWNLANALVDCGLAVKYHGRWLGMHPQIAAVYMCALADRLSRRNSLATITDEPALHTALNGWGTGTLAHVLLDGLPSQAPEPGSPDEVARVFTLMAVTTVLPRDLSSIPMEKIVAAREKLLPSMNGYRQYLQSLAERFAELATVSDPGMLREHLDILVRGEIEPQVAELESKLRASGMQPIRSVLSMKALTPPALLAFATSHLGLPPVVSAAGAVAACFAGAAVDARQRARDASKESPVSYLVGLKRELSARDLISRSQALLHPQ